MKDLFGVWKNTKMVVLIALIASIYAAATIPFKAIPIIPGVAELRPAGVLPIAFGMFFGPVAAWGLAIGNLLGDIFGGYFAAGSLFGFIASMLYAYIPYKLWNSFLKKDENEPDLNSGKKIMLYMFISIITAGAVAMVTAWGVDLFGIAPFSVLGTVIMIQNPITACTLGAIVAKLLYPRIKKWNLIYNDMLPKKELPKNKRTAKLGSYITIGSIVICFPLALVFAYSTGGVHVPIVMVIGGIGTLGCIVGSLINR